MSTTSVKKVVDNAARAMLHKASICLLMGLMVVAALSFSTKASAEPNSFGPAYIGSYNYGHQMNLNFSGSFNVNAPNGEDSNSFLKDQITIATDGVNFEALPENSWVYQYSSYINIGYSNNEQVAPSQNTKIKIAAGTLADNGKFNEEMILNVSSPVIQSTEISADNHIVTIAFQNDIQLNTNNLASKIYLFRNGSDSNRERLSNIGGTAAVESGKVVIQFDKGLSGANNLIMIENDALKDSSGNIQRNSIVTAPIQAHAGVDDTAPTLEKVYFSNSNRILNLVFDEDVQSNIAEPASIRDSIEYYNPTSEDYVNLGDQSEEDVKVTFSGHSLMIEFKTSMSSSEIDYIEIAPNSIKDMANNVYTDWIEENVYPVEEWYSDLYGYFSHNGRWLNLEFDDIYTDNTLDADGISHLQDKIKISTDGTNFADLDARDVVTFLDNRVVIIFHDMKKSGSVKVKIVEGAFMDEHHNVQSEEFSGVIGYNVPDITGYIYSNAATELTFEDNELWRSKVKAIKIFNNDKGFERTLTGSEYILTEGKLTIVSGVFEKDMPYEVLILAEGYSARSLMALAHQSSELFYMTAPAVTNENGITAKINVLNTDLSAYFLPSAIGIAPTQTVVFQLMDADTPVSIVSAKLKMNTGTYSANFNVTDAAAKAYTVRAFIVSKYDADTTNIGMNMAKQVTQIELDLKQNEMERYANYYN